MTMIASGANVLASFARRRICSSLRHWKPLGEVENLPLTSNIAFKACCVTGASPHIGALELR
jgi:hypothetical protein